MAISNIFFFCISSSVPDAEILERKGSVDSTPNIKKNTATLSWYFVVNKVETVFTST